MWCDIGFDNVSVWQGHYGLLSSFSISKFMGFGIHQIQNFMILKLRLHCIENVCANIKNLDVVYI